MGEVLLTENDGDTHKDGGCNIDEGNKVHMSTDMIINFVPRFDPNQHRSAYSYK